MRLVRKAPVLLCILRSRSARWRRMVPRLSIVVPPVLRSNLADRIIGHVTEITGRASPQARVKPLHQPTPRQQARWKAIRQAQLQGLSMRATARVLGIARDTVSAYIRAGGPPGRQGAASSTSSEQTREDIFAEQLSGQSR